jgi:hypothetical protein
MAALASSGSGAGAIGHPWRRRRPRALASFDFWYLWWSWVLTKASTGKFMHIPVPVSLLSEFKLIVSGVALLTEVCAALTSRFFV